MRRPRLVASPPWQPARNASNAQGRLPVLLGAGRVRRAGNRAIPADRRVARLTNRSVVLLRRRGEVTIGGDVFRQDRSTVQVIVVDGPAPKLTPEAARAVLVELTAKRSAVA